MFDLLTKLYFKLEVSCLQEPLLTFCYFRMFQGMGLIKVIPGALLYAVILQSRRKAQIISVLRIIRKLRSRETVEKTTNRIQWV